MPQSRRTFIVTAFAAGLAGGGGLLVGTGEKRPALVWRGTALGGEARVSLYGPDPAAAKGALDAVAAEIDRLEQVFSLHRAASELSRLNRDGALDAPSRDLVEVAKSAIGWRERTGGAFDPTIQPIWLAAAAGNPATADLRALAGTPVAITPSRISLAPGCALTFNGIAQGRITDRVTEILSHHGFTDVVVDAGELRLPGRTRRAVGIPAAKVAVSVAEVAIATSEPKSMVLDPRGFRHHLIDPRTGDSPRHWQSISVFAPTAETADALSTAFAVMPNDAVADLAASIADVAIIGADWKGRVRRYGDASMMGRGEAVS